MLHCFAKFYNSWHGLRKIEKKYSRENLEKYLWSHLKYSFFGKVLEIFGAEKSAVLFWIGTSEALQKVHSSWSCQMQHRHCKISGKHICSTMGGKRYLSIHFSVPTFIYLRNYDTIIYCSFTDDNGIINSDTDAKYLYSGICQNPELAEPTSVKLKA